MSLQHVQSEQHVHGLLLQDRERRRQKHVLDLDLAHVNTAQDALRADPLGDAAPARVHQAHNVTALGTGGRHDGGLGAWVP